MSLTTYILKICHLPQRILRIIKRKCNQRHAYDYPATALGWKKYGDSPVYGNDITGSIFDPYIYKEHNLFILWGSERKTGNIIRLDSTDGIHWQNCKTVLEKGGKQDWDMMVNRVCVLRKANYWLMWFTGQTEKRSSIGYAISEDGYNFSKMESPVLEPTKRYENMAVMNPCVLWDKEKQVFKMWYAAGECYEPDVICYAESTDGIAWKRHAGNPVLIPDRQHLYEKYKVGGCQVIKHTDFYEMYYIGYQNIDVARICRATSTDGIRWKRDPANPLLSPSCGSWDAHSVYKPTVIHDDSGTTYLWYNGRKGKKEYIGLAKQCK